MKSKIRVLTKAEIPITLTTAMKIKRFDKWQWFDYIIITAIGAVIIFVFPINARFIIKLFIWFGLGAFISGVYYITLRMLWARMFPNWYTACICSKCNTVIAEKATKCPKCEAKFVEERTPEN